MVGQEDAHALTLEPNWEGSVLRVQTGKAYPRVGTKWAQPQIQVAASHFDNEDSRTCRAIPGIESRKRLAEGVDIGAQNAPMSADEHVL